ncbi:hypothetical protein F751_2525 [Auxenochlorella protothecoides]|uniref:Uncharacterized protein n=1 Tax=Auxenochlorella protothecoides TaxID=3075 RepID=A0A087SIX9_AUXPR|nr:hypothetical protein F751_2525 [Auxenochlorella protothecoides]KFM25683.1 hypothetical protein F751_2525 [Auxenochlorella protothecoides]
MSPAGSEPTSSSGGDGACAPTGCIHLLISAGANSPAMSTGSLCDTGTRQSMTGHWL